MKILVLDTVHGAAAICEGYLAKGYEVTAVDVYHITPDAELGRLAALGVRIAPEAPTEHFDIITMPCHCPDAFMGKATCNRRMFYSESVHDLITDSRFRIEVTGVKGKTSTCYLLAHILSACGKKVFLHTSRGQGEYRDGKHFISALKSIAPPSLLCLPEGDYDAMVCEISLGGSGKADIACITNLVEDYGIAKNTRRARDGKKDVLCDGVNIVLPSEKEIWEAYGKPLRLESAHISPAGPAVLGAQFPLKVRYLGREYDVSLRGDYLSMQYTEAMDMALEVCEAMELPAESVMAALASFSGVPGRGEVKVEGGVLNILDRNPGISHMSVEFLLSRLKPLGVLRDAVLLVDPVSKKVCDKMDKDLISDVAAKYGVSMEILDNGEIKPEYIEGKKTVIHLIKEGYQ